MWILLHWIHWFYVRRWNFDFTSLFSPYDFEKNGSLILSYFKNEVSLNLSDQTKFRLIEFNKIKTILTQKFMKEKQWVKNLVNILLHLIILTKLWLFYLQQVEEYLSISFASVIDAPAGIASASFTLVFSLTTGIIKKSCKQQETKRI